MICIVNPTWNKLSIVKLSMNKDYRNLPHMISTSSLDSNEP